jgi:hypothetical protein
VAGIPEFVQALIVGHKFGPQWVQVDVANQSKAFASPKIAVEFLQKEKDKRVEKNMQVGKVLAVAVTGPWRVFKKNLLGEPIQYNLPILCAVEYKSDKDLNVVRVYDSTLLTEEFKGVKMAPPFLGATVGNSYYIRASAIK